MQFSYKTIIYVHVFLQECSQGAESYSLSSSPPVPQFELSYLQYVVMVFIIALH